MRAPCWKTFSNESGRKFRVTTVSIEISTCFDLASISSIQEGFPSGGLHHKPGALTATSRQYLHTWLTSVHFSSLGEALFTKEKIVYMISGGSDEMGWR